MYTLSFPSKSSSVVIKTPIPLLNSPCLKPLPKHNPIFPSSRTQWEETHPALPANCCADAAQRTASSPLTSLLMTPKSLPLFTKSLVQAMLAKCFWSVSLPPPLIISLSKHFRSIYEYILAGSRRSLHFYLLCE